MKRPRRRKMPDPIPDTPENIMRAIVTTPPKTPTSSATSKESLSYSSPQQAWR